MVRKGSGNTECGFRAGSPENRARAYITGVSSPRNRSQATVRRKATEVFRGS
jgi:hypothetical protein